MCQGAELITANYMFCSFAVLAAEPEDRMRQLSGLILNWTVCWWSNPVWKSNLQIDFNVSLFECFDTSTFAVLRELDESNRFVKKSAESTSI